MVKALDICLHSLNSIQHYLSMMISDTSYDPHVSTLSHIKKLTDLCNQALNCDEILKLEGKQPDLFPEYTGTIIISCDASVKNNPGGPCSSGVVIRFPSPLEPRNLARTLPTATTNNQAEYDAIYEGLNYFRTFGAGTVQSIEVRTDSKLAVNQLNGTWTVKDEKLKHRYDSIQKLIDELKEQLQISDINIVWYPRNSTKDLKKANNLAQDVLGIKNH